MAKELLKINERKKATKKRKKRKKKIKQKEKERKERKQGVAPPPLALRHPLRCLDNGGGVQLLNVCQL